MKVLYVNYLFDRKYSSVGAAVHVHEFVNAAKRLGVNIKSCDLNKFDGEQAAGQSTSRAWLKKRLSRYVGQLNALISNIGYFRREWRLVKEEKPDALLVRYNLLNFTLPIIARLREIPLVLEVNSPMALENRQFNQKQLSLPFFPEWAERLNLRLASKVYTVSHALRNYFIEQGADPEKVTVVPNGVDIERFHPEVDGTVIRRQAGLDGLIVFGFIGSFHYWHGVEYFESYVGTLCQHFDNVGFLFVGDGPLRAELEEKFKDAPYGSRVVFSGYVEHGAIPRYLAAMDIVLAPYPPLTFFYFSPLKLFEYMAAGKPVVASRVGQIGEMVEDGSTGLLYEAGDQDQLVAASVRLIEDDKLRKEIGVRARELVCREYSWQTNATRVVGLLEHSMNGKHG